MLPSEPSRTLTPEEEAALLAIQQQTGPPTEYIPGSTYVPAAAPPPESSMAVPMAAPASPPPYIPAYTAREPAPIPGDPAYDRVETVGHGPFTTPTGWQHGAPGTAGGKASAMRTSYPSAMRIPYLRGGSGFTLRDFTN